MHLLPHQPTDSLTQSNTHPYLSPLSLNSLQRKSNSPHLLPPSSPPSPCTLTHVLTHHAHSLTLPFRTIYAVESTGALLHWRRVSREPTRYVTPYAPFQHHDMHHHMYMINMRPQQVVRLGKYHHERSTEEVCRGGGRMLRRVRMGRV